MSGALPWTGSKHDGYSRSGFMLAEGAMPIVPVQAGPRSERMSPKRFDPTTTSNQSGCCTKCAVRMSMWYCDVFTSGYCALIALKRSSQYGMVIAMPLDFVADVTCFFSRVRASSKANFMIRSQPFLEKIESCVANSWSVSWYMRPPTDEYSRSE